MRLGNGENMAVGDVSAGVYLPLRCRAKHGAVAGSTGRRSLLSQVLEA